MTGRILIVDDIESNVRLLEARLSAEYYTLRTATNGQEALQLCEKESFDLILCDVMMPVMDGLEACRRLKANPKTQHIPIILLTALDQPADRVQGLLAGADDFLTKPVNDLALLTRVKSLLRLKSLLDELRMRADTSRTMGLPTHDYIDFNTKLTGKVLLVDDSPMASRIIQRLNTQHDSECEPRAESAIDRILKGNFDLVMISLDMGQYDGLRLCAQIRADERLRQFPILILVNSDDQHRLLRAIDLGVNDYLTRPIDANEMFARVTTQVRRKRYADSLRFSVDSTIEMAIRDALTGVHNRRYFESHIASLFNEAITQHRPLSVVTFDLDRFKSINDQYGHDVGDEVIKEFAARIQRNMRSADFFARMGGEEFSMIMPDTDLASAMRVAERLRLEIAQEPFRLLANMPDLPITVSLGVASVQSEDSAEDLLKRADLALYSSKAAGRNQVSAG